MSNLSIHKIFMNNVQAIKNIQISNGEFHQDNEVYGKNIGTNFHIMSSYRYNYEKYERITNILADTNDNAELYKDKILKMDAISTKILKLEKLIL